MVGLYGDPDVSWSVLLELEFEVPRDRGQVEEAAARLVEEYPHLGAPPQVVTFAPATAEQVRATFADATYGDHDPLVRAALSGDCRTLLVAAHHGAVDGLGLLGVAAALAGARLTSSARGIERSTEPTGFVAASLRRLAEAAFFPPVRFASNEQPGAAVGDWLLARPVRNVRSGSAALLMGVVAAVRAWNARTPARGRRLVIAMGLSRRPGAPTPVPDRDTAFMRLVATRIRSVADAAALVAATAPEPVFPVSDGGGLGPRFARRLSGRLGSTALVSNLGLVVGDGLRQVRFWPVPTGPSGVAIGLASVGTETVLTLRVRRGWFGPDQAEALADLVVTEFVSAAQA